MRALKDSKLQARPGSSKRHRPVVRLSMRAVAISKKTQCRSERKDSEAHLHGGSVLLFDWRGALRMANATDRLRSLSRLDLNALAFPPLPNCATGAHSL